MNDWLILAHLNTLLSRFANGIMHRFTTSVSLLEMRNKPNVLVLIMSTGGVSLLKRSLEKSKMQKKKERSSRLFNSYFSVADE